MAHPSILAECLRLASGGGDGALATVARRSGSLPMSATAKMLVTIAGQYLAAAVVYGSLYGRSAVGNPYDYFGAIDKDTKEFVQKVADETVRKFYGR